MMHTRKTPGLLIHKTRALIKPQNISFRRNMSRKVSFGDGEDCLFSDAVKDKNEMHFSTYDARNMDRFDTITNINAFLRSGEFYWQNKKTKKNEPVCPGSDWLFILNPINGKDNEFEITILASKTSDEVLLKTPMSKICFKKIELAHSAFIWIVGPKPYLPEKGSKGSQYLFVFDSQDDCRDLSMELIKVWQTQYNQSNLKSKFDENIFSGNSPSDT